MPDTPRHRLSTPSAAVCIVATTALCGLLIRDRPSLDTGVATVFVVAAFVSWAAVVRQSDVALRRVGPLLLAAIGMLLTLAVVTPPQGSKDLWAYAEFGREASVHDTSPYSSVPADFPHDRLIRHMGDGYRQTRSPYGPAFTAYSAAGTALVGDTPLANRLLFQLTAAGAVVAALALLWRRTKSLGALAWFGLNPLVVISVVNDGHNDALVALALLAGVLLATDRRRTAAGIVLGLGALVKLPVLLGVFGVAVWAWRREGARAAAHIGAVAGGVVVAGYAVVGTAALSAIDDSAGVIGRASWLSIVRDWLLIHGHVSAADALPAVGTLAVLVLGGALGLAMARSRSPAASAAGAAAAFPFAGSYVLPWYAAWGLPSLALRRTSPLAWLVAAQGAFLLAVYELPDHANAADNGLFVHRFLTDVMPIAFLASAAALAVAMLLLSTQAGRRSFSLRALSRMIRRLGSSSSSLSSVT
jgi:hypothetical protein